MSTVCDSSPLIGLHAIGRLDLLDSLFGNVIVPPAVAREIQRFGLPAWITIVPVPCPEIAPIMRDELGAGERDAIALAIQLAAERIVLDDGAARAVARGHHLRVIGVLGILLSAKQLGFISSVRGEMEGLMAAEFHISPRVYRELLVRAGEL